MGLRYGVPLPGPFYYSGCVGSKRWIPRGSHTGPDPMGFVVKWFIIYPSVAFFVAGFAILLAPFYGLFWVVRRLLRNRQKCRPYGFIPAQRPVPAPAYTPSHRVVGARKWLAMEGGPFGSDRYV